MPAKKKTEEAEAIGFEVAEAYKGCTSFLAWNTEIPIREGKILVTAEMAEFLRGEGYVK